MIDPKDEYEPDELPENEEGEIDLDNGDEDDLFLKHHELHRSGTGGG